MKIFLSFLCHSSGRTSSSFIEYLRINYAIPFDQLAVRENGLSIRNFLDFEGLHIEMVLDFF